MKIFYLALDDHNPKFCLLNYKRNKNSLFKNDPHLRQYNLEILNLQFGKEGNFKFQFFKILAQSYLNHTRDTVNTKPLDKNQLSHFTMYDVLVFSNSYDSG